VSGEIESGGFSLVVDAKDDQAEAFYLLHHAHSGDPERPIRSIVNTVSDDHEHPLTPA